VAWCRSKPRYCSIARDKRSDLNCAFEFTPSGRNFVVGGKVTGDHIELADAFAVFSVFSPSVAGGGAIVAASDSGGAGPDGGRHGVRLVRVSKGRWRSSLKSATAGKDWSMTGLNGVIEVDPAKVILKKT